jgi:hypothetical protein
MLVCLVDNSDGLYLICLLFGVLVVSRVFGPGRGYGIACGTRDGRGLEIACNLVSGLRRSITRCVIYRQLTLTR